MIRRASERARLAAPAAAIIGGGVTLRIRNSIKLAFGYDAELRATATSHTLQAAVKWVW